MNVKNVMGMLCFKKWHGRVLKTCSLLTITVLILFKPVLAQVNETTQRPATVDTTKRSLQDTTFQLQEVEVSTGYQTINQGRSTGSIFVIDSAVFNRSNSTSLLDRLDGIGGGLVFNRNKTQGSQSDIILRGRSTIFADDRPLIVVDNFPFEGDLRDINPNDIRQINILKDAAAAAIWGTRAGNGVIVITTRRGSLGAQPRITAQASTTIGQSPDLFASSWLPAEEWLEIEQYLYRQGAFTYVLLNGYSPVSPAVEIMDRKARGLIGSADSLDAMNAFKGADVRRDMGRYLYRTPVNQQYTFDISGGGEFNSYYLSVGYDGNRSTEVANSYHRVTLNGHSSYRFLNNRAELGTGISFTSGMDRSQLNGYTPLVPYESLADGEGNHLAVTTADLRSAYADTAGGGKLLDWRYRPLDDTGPNTVYGSRLIRLNTSLSYSVARGVKASILYQHQHTATDRKSLYPGDSYYVRNQINRYSAITGSTGEVEYGLPSGDIADLGNGIQNSHYGRSQLDIDRSWREGKHHLTAVVGFEIRDDLARRNGQRMYGYNDETGRNRNDVIDYGRDYPLYYNPYATSRIAEGSLSGFTADRYRSLFLNAVYTMDSRYTLSGSIRKDESNLFGVKPNQRGVPLWSAGLLWEASAEDFYGVEWLPLLRMRISYGHSGNVSKTTTSYLTAVAASYTNRWGVPFNEIINPPNPSLGWEKVRSIGFGLDLASRDRRIAISIEPYLKYGTDLIGESPLAPQVGLGSYTTNSAGSRSTGFDLDINSRNFTGKLRWDTQFLLSVNRDEITDYKVASGTNSSVIKQSYNNPVVGNPFFSLYAYPWAGLDAGGSPLVYLDGVASNSYGSVSGSTDRGNLAFMGSTVPTTTGSIRNTLAWGGLQLSFNVTYRLGYFVRRSSLDNSMIYSSLGFAYAIDYDKRWQLPGDELRTNVPALTYPVNQNRTDMYTYSDILVEKGDNIKLQDLRLSWSVKRMGSLPNGLEVYIYVNNLGYLWRANRYGLDPDYPTQYLIPSPGQRTAALGLKTNL